MWILLFVGITILILSSIDLLNHINLIIISLLLLLFGKVLENALFKNWKKPNRLTSYSIIIFYILVNLLLIYKFIVPII
jgi:hypothetical protein